MALVFDASTAREIFEALLKIEAREAGRRFVYTVSTQSNAPAVGTHDHVGLLRTHAADSVTIGTEDGDVEIGWYQRAAALEVLAG